MEMPPIHTPPWLDKSLWLVLITPFFLFMNANLGIRLDATELAGLVLPIVAYIAGNKWKTGTLQARAMQYVALDISRKSPWPPKG